MKTKLDNKCICSGYDKIIGYTEAFNAPNYYCIVAWLSLCLN